jgi:uncharacterized protein (TIGR03067 family)
MLDDLELLQGKWVMTSLEVNGEPLSLASFAAARISIEGNQFTSTGMGAIYRGTIEIDATKIPKRLSMNFTDGPEKDNTNHGIYELVADSWTLCLATTGGPAPKTFATAPGSGQALETLRRE